MRPASDALRQPAAVVPAPAAERWAFLFTEAAVHDASLRHVSHWITVTAEVTWCDRRGAYAAVQKSQEVLGSPNFLLES